MSEAETSPQDREALEAEAAHWFARLRGPDAAAHRADFEAWLATSAAHRTAYNRAAEIFAMGKLLADAPEVPVRRRTRGPLIAAACAALALAGGWTLLQRTDGVDPRIEQAAQTARETRSVATGTGETRLVRLADGSTVQLASDTRLEIALDASRRAIRLQSGRARFTVAHAARPFIVLAGGGSVTARGTVFEVGLRSTAQVDVRLLEGAIDVALPAVRQRPAAPAPVRRLVAGESLTFTALAEPVRVTSGNTSVPAPSTAPNAAIREFDGVTVAELVAQANANATRKVLVTDPALGAERVSGRFRVDDGALLAERLAVLLDARVEDRGPDGLVLHR